MAYPPVSDDTIRKTLRAVKEKGSYLGAATLLGIGQPAARRHCEYAIDRGLVTEDELSEWGVVRIRRDPPQFDVPELPSEDRPIEELLEDRKKTAARVLYAAGARKLIPVNIRTEGPFGICIFGDIHIDDPGADFALLEAHTKLVKETDGLFAGAVGDMQNAWVGRLARLYAEQSTTAREAWQLIEWWCHELEGKLLWVTSGNHDMWAVNVNGLNPLDWLKRQIGMVHTPHKTRLELRTPNGANFIIHSRHDFKGSSVYHGGQGPLRKARFGWDDDVLCCGHKHESFYQFIKHPKSERASHLIRCASYKKVDHYADQEGFDDNDLFECPMVILRPDAEDQRYRVKWEPEPFVGAEVLGMMRAEWKAKKGGGPETASRYRQPKRPPEKTLPRSRRHGKR